MTVVTVSAHGRAGIAAGHGFRVHALSIRQEWPIADAASLHRRFVTVTLAARLGNGRSVDCRIWIGGRQDRRHVAILRVAIKTRRRFRTIVNRLGMETVIVTSVRRGVEKGAGQVRKRLPRGVAPLTLETWRLRRSISIRPADNASFVRFYRRRRSILIRVLITLGLDKFECVQTERGADQDPSQDDSDGKVASHRLGSSGAALRKIPPTPYHR